MPAAKLFSVIRGKVVSIKDFGAFVSLEGSDRQGLVHRSQISNHPVDNVADVLEVGEKIFIKVISDEEGKLGLSMKLVNQTTGEDRDPNNLVVAQMEKRRRGDHRGQSPIRLEAELNTICKRCGVKGHLASSCFSRTGEKSLGLVSSASSNESDAATAEKSTKDDLKKRKRRNTSRDKGRDDVNVQSKRSKESRPHDRHHRHHSIHNKHKERDDKKKGSPQHEKSRRDKRDREGRRSLETQRE